MNMPTLPDPPGMTNALRAGGVGPLGDQIKATSLRQKATYQPSTSGKATTKSASMSTRTGPRLILFIVGGVTYSELCVASKIEQAKQRDITIGASDILTPTKFIQELASLSTENHVKPHKKH